MKKFLVFLLSIVFAVTLCVPMLACNKDDPAERKRIIGIDSDKTYLKAKFYLEHQRDLNYKSLYFEVLSYDKIGADELQGVSFDIDTGDDRDVLLATKYELKDTENNAERDGFYRYYVKIEMAMRWVVHEVQVNSITLNISGQEYVFSTDILFKIHNYRPVFIKPNLGGFCINELNVPDKGSYCVEVEVPYGMTLKSLNFQTEGYKITSYCVETYNSDLKKYEKVTDQVPFKLEAGERYCIYMEATPPDDCLYYSYDFEGVVEYGETLGELSGIEFKYTNIESGTDCIYFHGSALNALYEY